MNEAIADSRLRRQLVDDVTREPVDAEVKEAKKGWLSRSQEHALTLTP
jgi:hypothetical protein